MSLTRSTLLKSHRMAHKDFEPQTRQAAWQTLFGSLSSPEPVLRLLGLKLSWKCAHFLFQVAPELRADVVSLLLSIMAEDEKSECRLFASLILKVFCKLLSEQGVPVETRSLAFKTTVAHFIRSFPSKLETALNEEPEFFDRSKYVAPNLFQARIYLLNALAAFMGSCEEAQQRDFIEYVDSLIPLLLDKKVHPLLQTAAIQFVNESLKTALPMHRERVDALYFPLMTDLAQSLGLGSRENEKVDCHPCLETQIYRFFSTWCPVPSDEVLKAIPSLEKLRPFEDVFERKRALLIESPLRENADENGKSELQKRKKDKDRTIILTDFPETPESKKGDLELFGQSLQLVPRLFQKNVEMDSERPKDNLQPVVPDPAVLTFGAEKLIKLVKAPFEEVIYLHNKSLTTTMDFSLQVYPAKFFTVRPSFGSLRWGESLAIKVMFHSRPAEESVSQEIRGCLKVRSALGFTMERLRLSAYTGSPFRILPQVIDFGLCPATEKRTAHFTIENLLPIEQSLVCVIKDSPFKSWFSLDASQHSLKARESIHVKVKLTAFQDNVDVNAKVLIVGQSQIFTVKLVVSCRPSLLVLDQKLDFGFVDIYHDGCTKTLALHNQNQKQPLPVGYESSCDELLINDGMPILIPPGSSLTIPVKFTSAYSGHRAESLVFFAPASYPIKLDVLAISGPPLLIPVQDDIFLPLASPDCSSSALFPITNISSAPIQFTVTVPVGSCLKLALADPDKFNRKPLTGALKIEHKVVDFSGGIGLIITLNPLITMGLEIFFTPTKHECTRVPLDITVLKPKRSFAKVLYLICIGVEDLALKESLNLAFVTERKFSRNPGRIALFLGDSSKKVHTTDGPRKLKKQTTAIFQLDPPTVLVFGSYLEKKLNQDIYEYVTLSNNTAQLQKYHLVITEHFVTDIPLDGVLPASSTMQIPLRLNSYFFTMGVGINQENAQYAAIGSLAVIDDCNNGRAGFVSTSLCGIMADLVGLEVRGYAAKIQFPSGQESQQVTKKLILRNRCPETIVWEGGICSHDQFVLVRKVANYAEASPFILSAVRVNLKPFESLELEVSFASAIPGKAQHNICMEYRDTFEHGGYDAKSIMERSRTLEPISIEGSIGKASLSSAVEYLWQNVTSPGSVTLTSLPMKNDGTGQSNGIIQEQYPFSISSARFPLQPATFREAKVKFAPLTCGIHSASILLTDQNSQLTFFACGIGGFHHLSTSFGTAMFLQDYEKDVDNIYDIGTLGLGLRRKQVFELKNTGTLDLVISSIMVNTSGNLGSEIRVDSQDFVQGSVDKKGHLFSSEESLDFSDTQTGIRKSIQGQDLKLEKREPVLAKTLSMFPLRLPALKSLKLCCEVIGSSMGPKMDLFTVDVVSSSQESFKLPFRVKYNVQPLLQPEDCLLDFGIKDAREKHEMSFHFTNKTDLSLSWAIVFVETSAKSLVMKQLSLEPSVTLFTAFPANGYLKPGQVQKISVTFTPWESNCEVDSRLILVTKGFGVVSMPVRGVGATSRLETDNGSLDFGIIRVGTRKTLKFTLQNNGILSTKYFVDVNNSSFTAEPEEGFIEGQKDTEIMVTFSPKNIADCTGELLILPVSKPFTTCRKIKINLRGFGSYPDISVLTKFVDFGTALYKTDNCMPVKIQNKGTAEAEILFSSVHSDISLEGCDASKGVILGPKSIKEFSLIYHPRAVEELNTKATIQSSDLRGLSSVIQIKGSVGVPKLVFEPESVAQGIIFDVTRINSPLSKTFIMKNEGNIRLNYHLTPQTVSHSAIMIGKDKKFFGTKNAGMIFTASPNFGSLNVGESQVITVTFLPTAVMEYDYMLSLDYEFQSRKLPLKGTGGMSIMTLSQPIGQIDFGVCRISRTFSKSLRIRNVGNLGFYFFVRPEFEQGKGKWDNSSRNALLQSIINGDQTMEATDWISMLSSCGFKILNHSGYCGPYGTVNVVVEYAPLKAEASAIRLRAFSYDDQFDVDVKGRACGSKLILYDPVFRQQVQLNTATPTVDIGVHPVNSNYAHFFHLINDGEFGLDFFIQPMSIAEFEVNPSRGFIDAQSRVPLKIKFRPSTESKYRSYLKIMWEQQTLKALITGKGGVGRLDLLFTEEDTAVKGLNFGMVPLYSACERKFAVKNVGMVAMSVIVDLLHDEFAIAQSSEAMQISQIEAQLMFPDPDLQKNIAQWQSNVRLMLDPDMGVEFTVRYTAKATSAASSNIIVRTEFDRLMVAVKGRGGTINLSHKGDASFGDIACNHTYSRKITITNSGSISSDLSIELLVVGHNSSDSSASYVLLSEVFTGLDPRSGWSRQQLCREKGIIDPSVRFSGRENWKLIALTVRKALVKEESASAPVNVGRGSVVRRSSVAGLLQMNNSHARLASNSSNYAISAKKVSTSGASTHFKRRQMLYHLVSTIQLTSQSTPNTKPFIRVKPDSCVLPSYGETTLELELNISTETSLLATLAIKADIPNTSIYEIPITASPRAVNIICDDTRILNFYRQPLGESETLNRTFTNVGHKDVTFKFTNTNTGLTITPMKGILRVGQTVAVNFHFKPVDETLQISPVIFEPDCSQPIRLKMYGGGGYAKASLSRYRRFDFGHCMIGKDTVSYLPIANEGNAILHLTKFELIETDTFFRGQDWPGSRVSLFPGKSYNLPIVFNPHEESPSPGRLIVGSSSETFEIELVGLGREAVLIVSKVALEFSECLIGNSYEQKLGLKNIGDVNYPVTFKLEREFPDIEFVPASMVITPFSENFVTISYTPSRDTKTTVVLTISSPYSTHKVPLLLHAGTAILEFETHTLNFGMFEKTTRPIVTMVFKNIGTVKTSFVVKDINRPSMFHIAQPKGLVLPGKSVEIPISHIKHQVEQFEEKIIVKTDLIDKIYSIKVRGQCEETVLHPEEFTLLSMGVCPVLESTTKPLSFTNYGRFPLDYHIKATYPLKAVPATGKVLGGQTETVNITWSPSGGYELRTQVAMVTNIGTFNIVIRGKAAYPEIFVDNMYLDFGVCAVGHSYQQSIRVENRGKVPLKFTIADPKEPSFTISTGFALLEPKESAVVDVLFNPATINRFMSSLLVECKGIHYKEVALVGVGGSLKFEVIPTTLNVGKIPFNLQTYHSLSLVNLGDVVVEVDFSEMLERQPVEREDCSFTIPAAMRVGPGRSVKCTFGITTQNQGTFRSSILLKTKENTLAIPVTGTGILISLGMPNRQLLQSEQLPATTVLELQSFMEPFEPLDFTLKRQSLSHDMDNRLIELVSKILRGLSETDRRARLSLTSPNKITSVPADGPLDIGRKRQWHSQLTKAAESVTAKMPLHSQHEVLTVLDIMQTEFLEYKCRDQMESLLVEDTVIEQVLAHGHLEVTNLSLSPLTEPVSPDVDLNLNPLLSRPLPFLGPSDGPAGHGRATGNNGFSSTNAYGAATHTFLPLNRKARNAKTVDFFR